ncbi:23972_t:CDS:1, partial [Racocetra persica]
STGFVNFGQKSFIKEHASSEQHKDAIRLDAVKKTVNKELEQPTEQNKNHIIGIAKIVYTLVQQDILLAKLLYMV